MDPRECPVLLRKHPLSPPCLEGDGFLGCSLAADRRLVEVLRILEVLGCGASCGWEGRLVMIQAPVYVVPHGGVSYTRGFSVSGTTLSVTASFLFLFPGEETRGLESQHIRPQALNTRYSEPNHPFLFSKAMEKEMSVKNGIFFLTSTCHLHPYHELGLCGAWLNDKNVCGRAQTSPWTHCVEILHYPRRPQLFFYEPLKC